MNDVDTLLARMAAVPAPRSLGTDPAFVDRLDASAARGEVLGLMRSLAIGVAVAALMVATQPGPRVHGGGFLLVTADGEVL
ncbi:hypothetical protein [Sphingomonas rubra]|uniref:Uncharacterized protein n=1 Tax=Sphingomonas rubra TaxID=634430 RepID=A0A1I5SH93_9SPHN|nr:hypothetical protein [Sphingomonas rubra]SFP69877.1 hypothetical protein SAMN04488241_105219 [Sphingomonas rubra]